MTLISTDFFHIYPFLLSPCLCLLLQIIIAIIFWMGGSSLASYLLIGFWYEKPSANAAMKAFIVNRVGDFGFLLGIAVLYIYRVYQF